MRTVKALLPLFIAAAWMVGCAQTDGSDSSDNERDFVLGETGAALSVDYLGDSDVVGFHFAVSSVPCMYDGEFEAMTIEETVDLADNIFPGMVEMLEYRPLDPGSRHIGADFFVSLEPGCYWIQATPVSAYDENGYTPSEECSAVSTDPTDPVVVMEGYTTDVEMLISQCEGEDPGALDVPVALNHPPVLRVDIDEKFNYECEPVTVCATAWDPDNDPIEFVFDQESGLDFFGLNQSGAPVLIGYEAGHAIWQKCATITTQWTGAYEFSVTAYDLAWDNGSLVRFETLVAPEESHATLTFPIYTNWIEEPACIDDMGNVVPADGVSIDRFPGCYYTDAETWYCTMASPEIRDAICPNGTFDPYALYPLCNGNDL